MRLPSRWLGTTSALVLACGAAAADPAALVARLGDPVYAVREAAQRELVARGPDALRAVEAAAGHSDPEVRDRAATVAARLRRLAEQAPLIAAKRVKLDYAGRPLADAVADFRARTGLNVQLDPALPAPGASVTVTTADLPVWEAAEALRRAAGLRESPPAEFTTTPVAASTGYRQPRSSYYGGPPPAVESAGQVPVVWAAADGRPEPELPAARSHAVRVRALPATFPGHKVVRGTGQVVLALDVTPPAGMPWADGATVRLDRAEDETGRPVSAVQSPPVPVPDETDSDAIGLGRVRVVLGANGGAVFLDDRLVERAAGPRPNPRLVTIALRTDDRAVRRLRVLDGAVVGTIVVPDQPLVAVADLARAAGTTTVGVNGVRLTVTRFDAGPAGTTVVGLTHEQPAGPADDILGRRLPNGIRVAGFDTAAAGSVRFQTAAGHPRTPRTTVVTGRGVTGGGYEQTTYEFGFGFGTAPAAVTLVGPKSVVVEVPFRLRDVPLP